MGEKLGGGYINESGEFVRGQGDPEDTEKLELGSQNLRRLESLMGPDFNEMEMSDYLSYISPEKAGKEIDEFESKLNNLKISREDLIEKFKAHLGYLAA